MYYWENIKKTYRLQIESTLGLSILGAGLSSLGGCNRDSEKCLCCCQDKTSITGNYTLVDTSTASHVGPLLKLETICGCQKESLDSGLASAATLIGDRDVAVDGLDENKSEGSPAEGSLPSAHAVLSEEAPSCRPNTCLNGGRCLIGSDHRPRWTI